MHRRLPKVGFKNPFRTVYFGVNVGALEERCEAGAVTVESLKAIGLVPRSAKLVKILGTGDVKKKFSVEADGFSGVAKEKIEKAGGQVKLVAGAVESKA